jgi:hypothetical protein
MIKHRGTDDVALTNDKVMYTGPSNLTSPFGQILFGNSLDLFIGTSPHMDGLKNSSGPEWKDAGNAR